MGRDADDYPAAPAASAIDARPVTTSHAGTP